MENLSENRIQLMIGLLQDKIDSADTAKTDVTMSRLDARRCQQAFIELGLARAQNEAFKKLIDRHVAAVEAIFCYAKEAEK